MKAAVFLFKFKAVTFKKVKCPDVGIGIQVRLRGVCRKA